MKIVDLFEQDADWIREKALCHVMNTMISAAFPNARRLVSRMTIFLGD